MESYLRIPYVISLLPEAQIQFQLCLLLKFSHPRYIKRAIDYVVK